MTIIKFTVDITDKYLRRNFDVVDNFVFFTALSLFFGSSQQRARVCRKFFSHHRSLARPLILELTRLASKMKCQAEAKWKTQRGEEAKKKKR